MSSMCTIVSHCVCVVWVLLAVVCLYIQIISPYIYICIYIGPGMVLGSFWVHFGVGQVSSGKRLGASACVDMGSIFFCHGFGGYLRGRGSTICSSSFLAECVNFWKMHRFASQSLWRSVRRGASFGIETCRTSFWCLAVHASWPKAHCYFSSQSLW